MVLSEMLGYPRSTIPDLLQKWWSDCPGASSRPHWQRRLSPWRAAELVGEYTGDRAGARRRADGARSPLPGMLDLARPDGPPGEPR